MIINNNKPPSSTMVSFHAITTYDTRHHCDMRPLLFVRGQSSCLRIRPSVPPPFAHTLRLDHHLQSPNISEGIRVFFPPETLQLLTAMATEKPVAVADTHAVAVADTRGGGDAGADRDSKARGSGSGRGRRGGNGAGADICRDSVPVRSPLPPPGGRLQF